MEVFHLVLPNKFNRCLEGLRALCIRWWKRKVIRGMFKFIDDKYGGLYRSQEGETLGVGYTTGSRRESRRGGKGKATK